MSVAFSAILASTLSSLLGLSGGFLLLTGRDWFERRAKYFVSFAAGALLAAAFFDLLTEAVTDFSDQVPAVFAWTVVGFLAFFVIEKYLLWHHHTHQHVHEVETPNLAKLMIVGDMIHNAIDGLIIGATFLVSPALGTTTAVAVFFHELPQELGDFSIMAHTGMARKKIVLWNVVGALVSPVATIVALFVGERTVAMVLPLLGIAAGSFIYIAAADLVPQIHQERKFRASLGQFAMLALGILVIFAVGKFFAE